MKFSASTTRIDKLILRGVPVKAWARIAAEVQDWKRRDLSRNPNLQVRTGQLRDSITARRIAGRGKKKGTFAWKVMPWGLHYNRNKKKKKVPRLRKGEYGPKRPPAPKKKRLRAYDLMFYQVRKQGIKFMALTSAQRGNVFSMATKLLTAAIRRGEVGVDVKGRPTKI